MKNTIKFPYYRVDVFELDPENPIKIVTTRMDSEDEAREFYASEKARMASTTSLNCITGKFAWAVELYEVISIDFGGLEDVIQLGLTEENDITLDLALGEMPLQEYPGNLQIQFAVRYGQAS